MIDDLYNIMVLFCQQNARSVLVHLISSTNHLIFQNPDSLTLNLEKGRRHLYISALVCFPLPTWWEGQEGLAVERNKM